MKDLILEKPCFCPRKRKRCDCIRPDTANDQWLFSRYSTGWKCGLHADWTELNDCVEGALNEYEGGPAKKRRYFFVTILRDPVHRYISEFRHVQRGATWKTSRHWCGGREFNDLPLCYKVCGLCSILIFKCMGHSTTDLKCLGHSKTDFKCLGCSTTDFKCLGRFTTDFKWLGRYTTDFQCLGNFGAFLIYFSVFLQGANWTGVDIEQFMDCSFNLASNRQTRMLADLNLVGCYNATATESEERGKVLLASAKANLARMAYFGLTEQQQASQYVFEETFKLDFEVAFEQYNATLSSLTFNELTQAQLERIRQLNNLDVELYAYASSLLDQRFQQIKQGDPYFDQHWDRLGRANVTEHYS